MALNLVDLIGQRFDTKLIEQISGLFGMDTAQAAHAVKGAVPAIVAGMMDKAGSPEGASSLLSSLKDLGREDDLLDNLPALLAGGGHESLTRAGGNFMKSLFGDKAEGFAASLGALSGVDKASAGSLLNVITPVAVGVLGKQQHALGLDASGLTKLLGEQKDAVASALPAELAGALDFKNLKLDFAGAASKESGSVLDSTNEAADSAAIAAGYDPDPKPGGGFWKVILLVVIAIVVWFGYQYLFAGAPVDGTGTTG